jgi:transcriptional regulator with XRE-family HTH domain
MKAGMQVGMKTKVRSIRSVRSIRDKAGLSQEQMARLLGTSWVTISRWEREQAKPTPAAEARLGRLRMLLDHIGTALRAEDLEEFLETPIPVLKGYKPVELLESDYGFRDLISFVEGAKSGDMA